MASYTFFFISRNTLFLARFDPPVHCGGRSSFQTFGIDFGTIKLVLLRNYFLFCAWEYAKAKSNRAHFAQTAAPVNHAAGFSKFLPRPLMPPTAIAIFVVLA